MVKNPPANAEDVGLIPQWGRSPVSGNGNPLQYSCLGNPMDRGAWWATVCEVAESDTIEQLGTHTHTHTHIYIYTHICRSHMQRNIVYYKDPATEGTQMNDHEIFLNHILT